MSDNYQASGNFNTSINEEKQKSNGEPKAEQETTTGTAKPTASRFRNWSGLVGWKLLARWASSSEAVIKNVNEMREAKKGKTLKAFGNKIVYFLWMLIFILTLIVLILIAIPMFCVLVPPMFAVYFFRELTKVE